MSEKDLSLGEFLRTERELRGITIEQVASATKVGVRTLHALEADHYSELPAKPYIRGFVTSYCRFIGLDPKEIRSRFDQYISKRAMERPNREGGHSGYAFDRKDGDQQSRTVLLIAICSFIGVGGIAVILLKPSLKRHHASHIDRLRAAQSPTTAQEDGRSPTVQVSSSPSPMAGLSADSQSHSGASSKILGEIKVSGPSEAEVSPVAGSNSVLVSLPAPSPSPVVSSVPSELVTNAKDPLDSGLSLTSAEIQHKVIFKPAVDVWFRYQVDDRSIRKFIVRKGKILVLRAARQIRAQVSAPSSVSFSYNGKGSTLVAGSKLTRMIHGTASLVFNQGASGADGFDDPFFNVDIPLPKTVAPGPSDSVDSQSH